MKLAIGTAQFGLNYGISNRKGKIEQFEAEQILDECWTSGIDMLDTAAGYGTSEDVVGKILSDSGHQFKIITKLPSGIKSNALPDAILTSIHKLKIPQLYGVLVHQFDDLLKDDDYLQSLLALKNTKHVQKIGVSVYYPSQVDWILQNNVPIDLVQLPYNVLDTRFHQQLEVLKQRGIEIHSRSVFLQGLLLMKEADIDRYFAPILPVIRKLNDLATDHQIKLNAVLLGFVYLHSEIDRVVIGVESLANLQDNVFSLKNIDKVHAIYGELRNLSIEDEGILLPFNWKTKK